MHPHRLNPDVRIQQARELFDEGRDVPPNWVRGKILHSWLRSKKQGLSHVDQILLNTMTGHDIHQIRDSHRWLLNYVEPEMQRLFRSIGSAGWVLACLESKGRSIKYFGGDNPNYKILGSALDGGVDLSEAVAGTNGPGCALIDHKPSVVCGSEHFLHEFRGLSCVAVPIFDPSGKLVGAINATKSFDGRPIGVLESVALTARAVENRMIDDLAGALVLAIHYRPELTNSPMRGLLHFCEDGRLLGANPSARQMLDLDFLEQNERPVCFDDLFSCHPDVLRRSNNGSVPTEVGCHTGQNLYVCAETGRTAAVNVSATLKPEGSLQKPPFFADESIKALFDKAHRAFRHNVPILINGETGTGKEVLARWLHASGPTSTGPFVAVNCSAIPAGLIESELFGYVDGAFTGARRGGAKGKFEEANGGTLFLDEIGDMPLDFQTHLLRVLQERTVTRLGEEKSRPVSFSLISATHRNLCTMMEKEQFRDDLYYRINGLKMTLPALRERKDLDAVIDHLLALAAFPDTPAVLSSEARSLLRNHAWKGNVRELQQALNLGQALARKGVIRADDLPDDISENQPLVEEPDIKSGMLEDAELQAVRNALKRHGSNVSSAARELGVTRATLYRKMKKFDL